MKAWTDEECDKLATDYTGGFFRDKAHGHGSTICRHELRAVIRAAVEEARREEREACIEACKTSVPRAHTYASENADLYRAGDNARDRCIAAILARDKGCDHKFVDSKHCLRCGWVPSDKESRDAER